MKFTLIVDPSREEEIVATVHAPSALTDQLEQLVLRQSTVTCLPGYREDEMKLLPVAEIACITVVAGKTYAIDRKNRQYRLKQRLYELEAVLPSQFIRINKSALANEQLLDRFSASFNGAVDAIFQGGHREYVSRRCFAQIKRRYEK